MHPAAFPRESVESRWSAGYAGSGMDGWRTITEHTVAATPTSGDDRLFENTGHRSLSHPQGTTPRTSKGLGFSRLRLTSDYVSP